MFFLQIKKPINYTLRAGCFIAKNSFVAEVTFKFGQSLKAKNYFWHLWNSSPAFHGICFEFCLLFTVSNRKERMELYKLLIKLHQCWWNQSVKGWKLNLDSVIILFLSLIHCCYLEIACYLKANWSTRVRSLATRLCLNHRHSAMGSMGSESETLRF